MEIAHGGNFPGSPDLAADCWRLSPLGGGPGVGLSWSLCWAREKPDVSTDADRDQLLGPGEPVLRLRLCVSWGCLSLPHISSIVPVLGLNQR